ncbi:unnamed protein product, partial [Polarella glacialis]
VEPSKAKKPRLGSEGTCVSEVSGPPGPGQGGDPQTIIAWNVNGLTTQLRDNWNQIRDFLEKEKPDVLCIQEVRMAAAGPRGCKRGDGQKRRRGEAKRESAQ